MVKRSVPVTRGSLSHLIVPQSKTWVSTAAGVTKRRPASLDMPVPFTGLFLDAYIFEAAYLLGNGTLGRQALDARGAKESADALGPAENILDIFRFGDRAAVTEDENFRVDGDGRFLDGLYAGNRLVKRDGCFGADGPFRGQAHVCDQKVRAGFRHRDRLIFIKDIGTGKQVQLVSTRNHLHFLGVSHAGFLQVLAEETIDEPHRREVLHSREAELLQLAKKAVHHTKRIGSAHAG